MLSLCLVSVSEVPATGQEALPQPLTSNRPGIGDSEALVGRAVVQVEAGIQGGHSRSADEERHGTWSWGETTLRVGVADPVEVFLAWDGLSIDHVSQSDASHIDVGGSDLRLGAKVTLLNQAHHGLTLTIAPSWSAPLGADAFSTHSNDGVLRLMWARSLPGDWAMSGNFAFDRTTDTTRRTWDNAVTTEVTKSLSSAVSAFVELAGDLPEGNSSAWLVDGGVGWVSRTNVQWDVSGGCQMRGPGDAWFVSGGITLRRLPRRDRSAAGL